MRFFGAHVSCSGGLECALDNAQKLGINTIQLHPSPPQRWNGNPFPAGYEAKFLEKLSESGVSKVFFHAIYLINLASPDAQQQHLSKVSLRNYLDLAGRIGADGVIVHVGSMKDEPDEAVGWKRAADNINWIFEHVESSAKLLLEVAAGSGKVVGDRLEELATIVEDVRAQERVGFALDSQHLWASGYDVVGNLEEIVSDVEGVFGIDRVGAIHLNDSKTELGSRKDRHENIGDGLIGNDGIRRLFLHPQLSGVPFILETPHLKSLDTAAIEVGKLREFLGCVDI